MHLWTCASSDHSDQLAHSRKLIRIFTEPILDDQKCTVSSCGQRILRSDCADAQVNVSLRRAHVKRYVFHLSTDFVWFKTYYFRFQSHSFIPADQYRYFCNSAVSSGSTRFAILFLILGWNPLCNNGCVQFQRWKSPVQKFSGERIKQGFYILE